MFDIRIIKVVVQVLFSWPYFLYNETYIVNSLLSNRCKSICVSTSNLLQEIQQKNEEISTLQESLSDVQVYLYREREQVLKLYAENDALQVVDYIIIEYSDLKITVFM